MRKKLFSLMMTLVLAFTGIARADELTICDGTSRSAYIPVYGLYVDTEGTISEFIIPADSLTNMVGGEISGMTFYLDTPATGAWNATVQFYLAEVDGTTLTGVSGPDAGTVVFEGTVNANSVVMTVTFDDNYTYNGGNLLVGSYVTGAGTYKNAYFEGVETTETTAYCSYEGWTGVQNEACSFLPKVTFTYESGSSEPENEYFYISASGWAIWAGAPAVYPSEPGDECVIDALYVDGFVEPAVGVTVGDIDLTTDAENYSISSVAWFDNDDLTMTALAEDYEFEAGHTYYMQLQISIDDECALADSYTVYLNQEEGLLEEIVYDDNLLVLFSDDFEVEGADECIINTIELAGLVEPAYGAAPAYDITIPEGVDYTVGTVQWVYVNPTTTSESGTMQEGDLFNNENVEYYLMAAVYPVGDCEFDQNVAITINGEASLVNADLTEYNAQYNAYVVMSVGYTVSDEPEECVINTIELNGFEEPVEGGSTELNVTYSSNDYTLTAAWLDSDGYTLTAETFEIGNYFFYVEMTPNSDECTVEDLSYFINGTEVTPDQSGYSSTYGYYWFAIVYTASGDCAGGFDNDFEAGAFCDWTTLDADGDGHCWKMGGASTSTHGGAFSVYSESYYNDTHTILYPDNYLISPKTLITADKPYVSFWACAQDASWPAEYFGLGVSTTTADAESFVMLQNWTMTAKKSNPAKGLTRGNSKASGNWYQYIVDLSEYINEEVYVCIRHYNCSDKFFLNVDDISLISEMPAEPIVTLLNDFEDGLGDWTLIDADGDGNNWTINTSSTYVHDGSKSLMSVSYGTSALDPDNYVVSPLLTINAGDVLTFYEKQYSTSYPDHFGVAVSETSNTDASTFTTIADWTGNSTSWTKRTADLSAYAGKQVYVAIRHYDSYNQYKVYIDDISIVNTPAKSGSIEFANLGSLNLSGKTGISKDVVVSLNKQIASIDLKKVNAKDEAIKRTLAKANRDNDDPFVNYNLYLDNELIASTEDINELDHYMQEAESFEDGSEHTAKIEAVYQSGNTLNLTKDWTYVSGNHFYGASDDLNIEVEGNQATLSWEMPNTPVIGAIVYRNDEIINILREGETMYVDEFDGADVPTYCIRIIQDGSMDDGVYYAVAEKQCFEETPQVCVIDSLAVEGFVEPAVGVTVGDINITTSADNYSVLSVEWYDNEDLTMTALADDYEFEAGHSYYMTLDIQLSDECTLADDYTVYVNEDASIINPAYNYFYDGVLYTYSVDFDVEEDPQDECPAPANLTYTLNGGELTISWDASTMDDPAYLVYRSEDGENYSEIAFIEETTYTCGLFAEGTYYYKVTALGDNCESEPALTPAGADHIEVVYTPAATCEAPTNLTYTLNGAELTISWDASTMDDPSYLVYRSEDGENYTEIALVDETTYTCALLAEGTYYYQVTTLGDNCESDPALTPDGADYIMVEYTIPVATCEAPVNLDYNVDGSNVTLTWEMQSNVTVEGYNVYRAVSNNGSYELIANVTDATYTDEGLENGTYRYQVTAINVLSIDNTCESDPALAVDGENNYVEAVVNSDQCVINYVNVNGFEKPVYGGIVSTAGLTVDDDNYEITYAGWFEMTSYDPLEEGSTFGEGTYYLYVELTPNANCTVDTENLTLTFNGEAEDADPEWCGYNSSYGMFYMNTIYYTLINTTCDAPFNLDAEVDGENVTLTWNMAGEAAIFSDDFEDGALTNWTLIDADGDGFSWQNDTPADYGIGNTHSGTNCAGSWSWNNATMYPDNYMISPLVEGATRIHYYVATNVAYPDHYGVYVSSTGTNAADFTEIFDEIPGSKGAKGLRSTKGGTRSSMTKAGDRAMSAWMERSIDLPAGTKYVAFRHYDSDDMNYLFIDDVTIYATGVPEDVTYNVYRAVGNGSYELIAENVEDLTYTDEGLANGTYRYQVTANNTLSDGTPCESEPALAVDGENNYVEATIDVTYTCEAPTNFASSLEGDELTLTWNAVSDPNAVYAVYVTIDGVEQEADVVTETSATYTLVEGSTYYFQVTAMMTLPNSEFCESDPALTADGNNYIEIEFTPVTTCVAPVDLVVTVAEEGTNNVVLAWDMDADVIVNGFNVYRSTDNENYEVIATVTETTYTEETPGDGTYYYQVTALNALAGGECESEPAMDVNNEFNYVVITVDGINDLSNLIKLYPNPTKSNVTIEADNMSRIVIVNTLGQVVYDATVSNNNTVINMSTFGAGMYMLNITTDNGVIVKRVTVAK